MNGIESNNTLISFASSSYFVCDGHTTCYRLTHGKLHQPISECQNKLKITFKVSGANNTITEKEGELEPWNPVVRPLGSSDFSAPACGLKDKKLRIKMYI